jgi:phosphatidate cytidylyltransferase
VKNLFTRTITGILFIAILLGAVLWNPWSTGAVFLLVSAGCYLEFSRMYKKNSGKPGLISGLVAGSAIYLLLFLISKGLIHVFFPLFLIVPVLLILMAAEVLRRTGNSLMNTSLTIFGIIYIFVPFALTNFLVNDITDPEAFHPVPLVAIFILIWVNDIFAYLGGLLAGRHKLYKRLSPNKTWEGTISGIVFTIVASYPISLVDDTMSLTHWIVLALLVSVFGIFGDLFESMMKRNNEIKDSGSILPGHGGLLDRFDAFLFAMPIAMVYISLIAT